MEERFGVHGIITLHKIPDEWTDADFKYWYCPVTAPNGVILQPARISDETKRLWLAHEPVENIITNSGISYLLTNSAVQSTGSMIVFAQILAIGNGTISGVTRADTTVPGDGFATNSRKAPASHANTGFSTTITTSFASGDAVGTWTNIALVGNGATTTSGTGNLCTHALFSFVKGSAAYAVNYVLLLSN
jgi:hypothetical protein